MSKKVTKPVTVWDERYIHLIEGVNTNTMKFLVDALRQDKVLADVQNRVQNIN